MSRTNETVAILSIMAQIDKNSMERALKEANKTMKDIEIGFDGQKFENGLIDSYNEAINKLYKLSPKINLSKLQNDALVNIINSKDAESANNALKEYVRNLQILVDLTIGNKDNRTIFDNLSPKNIDKIIRNWEVLAKKRRDYESIRSGENTEYRNKANEIANRARTLKEIGLLYENSDDFSVGREIAVSDKTISVLKSQIGVTRDLTAEEEKQINQYSKRLDLYNQMMKLKPKFGTDDYIIWAKEMEHISKAIYTREKKMSEYAAKPTGFREFLADADGYSDAFSEFAKIHASGVNSAISGYIDAILKTMRSEINEMNNEFLADLIRYKDSDRSHAENDAVRLRIFSDKKKKITDEAVNGEPGRTGTGSGNGSGEGFSEDNAELKKFIVNADEAKSKILELSKAIDKKSKFLGSITLEQKDLEIAKEIFGYMQRYVDLNPDKTINDLFSSKNGFSQKDFPGEILRKFKGQNLGTYINEIEDFKNLIHSFSVETPGGDGVGGVGNGGIINGSLDQAEELLKILDAIVQKLDEIHEKLSLSLDSQNKSLPDVEQDILSSFDDIVKKFKEDFNDAFNSFSDQLKNLDNVEWSFDGLRDKLLGVVEEFKAALAASGLEIKHVNNVYEMLKGWNDADKVMNDHLDKTIDKNISVRERGAYFNSKTGKISNTFVYDKESVFSGELDKAIRDLVLNANEKISDLFDTHIHSHPIHDVTKGNLFKAIGSNVALSYEDLLSGINSAINQKISNTMVTSGDRYTNIDFSGITEKQKEIFLETYKKTALELGAETVEGGAKLTNFLVKDLSDKTGRKKLFDYDKLTDAVNDAIYAGLDAIGFDRSRLTTGHISDFDLNDDIDDVGNVYTDNFAQLISIAERILSVLTDLNSNGFRFASNDPGSIDIGLSPDSKSFEAKAAESLEMMYLDKTVELKPDVTEFEKVSNTVLTFLELDKDVELKPDVDNFQENSESSLDEIVIKKKVELIPDVGDRFTDGNINGLISGDLNNSLSEQDKIFIKLIKDFNIFLDLQDKVNKGLTAEDQADRHKYLEALFEDFEKLPNVDTSYIGFDTLTRFVDKVLAGEATLEGIISDLYNETGYAPPQNLKHLIDITPKTDFDDLDVEKHQRLTESFKKTIEYFTNKLSHIEDDVNWDFTNLRNKLLDVVSEFKNSLSDLDIESKPVNDLYEMLKGWNDADIGLSNAKINEDHSERGAFANLKTGKISNPYFYDSPGIFRGKIYDEIDQLTSVEEITELFDTIIHSHNIRRFVETLGEPGMPTVGSDVAFSSTDVMSAIDAAVRMGFSKSLVVNQGRYSLLDLSDLVNIENVFDRAIIGEKLKKAYTLREDNIDLASYVNENDEYDFDLLTNDVVKIIADSLEEVGLSRDLIKTGDLSDLNIEIPEETKENNFTKLISVVEKISSAVEYIKTNGLKTSVDNIASTTKNVNPYKDLFNKDFTTNSDEESLIQLAETYEAMKPFFNKMESLSTEEGRKAAYAYVQAWYDAYEKGIIDDPAAQQYLFGDYYLEDSFGVYNPLYDDTLIEMDESFKHIGTIIYRLSDAYDRFYDILGNLDLSNKPEFEQFQNYINELITHVKLERDAIVNSDYDAVEDQEGLISKILDDIRDLASSARDKYVPSMSDIDNLRASQDGIEIQVNPKFTPEDFIKEIESILIGHFARVDVKPKDIDGNEFTTQIESDIQGSLVAVNVKPVVAPYPFITSIEDDIEDIPIRVNVVPNLLNENDYLDLLEHSLDAIITKIHDKTNAFRTEEGVVAASVPHETELIGKLVAALHRVVDYLHSIQTEIGNLDFSKFANSKELTTFFDTFKNVCEDLYLLKDEGSILDTFTVTKGNVSNIENLAYAVDLLKETLTSFNDDARNALESLTLLSNQSDKLKDLYNALKEANKASEETKKKILEDESSKKDTEKETKKETEKVDKLGEAYKEITKSIKDYIKLAKLKASGIDLTPDQLEQYQILKTRINAAREGVDAYASAVDGANAHQIKFKNQLKAINKSEGIKYIETLQKKLDGLISKKDNKTPAYLSYIDILTKDISKLSEKLPLDFTDENALSEFNVEFEKILQNMDDHNSKEFNPVKTLDVQTMSANFETWVTNNSAALKQFGDQIEEIRRSFGNIVSEADKEKVKMAIAELRAEVNKTGAAGRSMFDIWKRKAKSFIAYLGTYVGFQDILQKLREGFDIAVTYDTQLTEMKKVSDETMASLKEFQRASFELGNTVGTTGAQIQASTADFMRLGESLDEAAQSALDANTLFKVSEFDSIEEATEALISMSQAYKELEKSEINDILNYVGNNFSISTEGLSIGLQKSAAALTTAGNDIYEAAALITAGNQVIQDPDQVGAGIRTISLRILGTEAAKDELASLGEDVDDFVVQTKSKIDQTVRDYTAVASNNYKGVSLLDDNGNYRSTYEILQDIADVYQEIVETDKKAGTNRSAALIEQLAGKNRSNIAASIVQNPELLREVYEEAQNASGSAAKELEAQLNSIESHIDKLKNQWHSIWITDYNREAINGMLDALTALLKVVESIGIIPALVSGGSLFGFVKNFDRSVKDCIKIA